MVVMDISQSSVRFKLVKLFNDVKLERGERRKEKTSLANFFCEVRFRVPLWGKVVASLSVRVWNEDNDDCCDGGELLRWCSVVE